MKKSSYNYHQLWSPSGIQGESKCAIIQLSAIRATKSDKVCEGGEEKQYSWPAVIFLNTNTNNHSEVMII